MTKGKTRDVEHFNRWSSTYDDSWMQRRLFDRVHSKVLALAGSMIEHSQPVTILDVGCGTGRLLRKAQTFWPQAHVIGVDAAEGMIDIARRELPEGIFYTGVAENLPLAEASVDVAVSTISFHHWHNQEEGLREIARVLRPGGYFLLADFVLPAWLAVIIRRARFHSDAQLRRYFERAGLNVRQQQQINSRHVIVTVGER
jgi:ubiquinone/menaquinone biosynthesis C-methylase UbiE